MNLSSRIGHKDTTNFLTRIAKFSNMLTRGKADSKPSELSAALRGRPIGPMNGGNNDAVRKVCAF